MPNSQPSYLISHLKTPNQTNPTAILPEKPAFTHYPFLHFYPKAKMVQQLTQLIHINNVPDIDDVPELDPPDEKPYDADVEDNA